MFEGMRVLCCECNRRCKPVVLFVNIWINRRMVQQSMAVVKKDLAEYCAGENTDNEFSERWERRFDSIYRSFSSILLEEEYLSEMQAGRHSLI